MTDSVGTLSSQRQLASHLAWPRRWLRCRSVPPSFLITAPLLIADSLIARPVCGAFPILFSASFLRFDCSLPLVGDDFVRSNRSNRYPRQRHCSGDRPPHATIVVPAKSTTTHCSKVPHRKNYGYQGCAEAGKYWRNLRRQRKLTAAQLTREYRTISENPPPYITAHPSESNILEYVHSSLLPFSTLTLYFRWHYILTGPEDTPYHNGQYWGTLVFPSNYPFAPPAIRMHTPSGRFQPSTRLCLSISDFHPKSFNPAWEVSTILTGLLSFMTSEEMTTGSISSTYSERQYLAQRSRWWNSTGGGSHATGTAALKGNVKAGDGGAKFRAEWSDLDKENWEWMKNNNIDSATGHRIGGDKESSCAPQLSISGQSGHQTQAVVDAVVQQRDAGRGWISRHKVLVAGGVIFLYVLIARLISGDRLA